jgi:hypothetical protein
LSICVSTPMGHRSRPAHDAAPRNRKPLLLTVAQL